MSWLHCNRCGDLINTDDDPAAFVETSGPSPSGKILAEWICERCREEMENENA